MVRKNEHRQRGKKRKAPKEDDAEAKEEELGFVEDRTGEMPSMTTENDTPAWMMDKRAAMDISVPFGLVESDLKAYLRSAHLTLQEHIRSALEQEQRPLDDDNVKAVRNAMLDEIKGKELILATDTDTSVVLEDLICTFGERQARILGDALTNECFTLVRHRFGSHVLQSLLPALQYFVSVQQQNATRRDENADGAAALRSAEQLLLDISEAIRANVLEVMQDQFASHVLRTLLLVLTGRAVSAEATRSKRSQKFHERSVLVAQTPWSSIKDIQTPPSFGVALHALLKTVKSEVRTQESTLRAMCVDQIGGPTLSLLVELDAREGSAAGHQQKTTTTKKKEFNLLDVCLDGLQHADAERSAHVETLLRDSVGSHVLEHVLKWADEDVVERFWHVYVQGRFTKLAAHPTANFVVATILRRLSRSAFEQACDEVEQDGKSIVKSRHCGVLIALIECGERLGSSNVNVAAAKDVWTAKDGACRAVRAVLRAFGFEEQDERIVRVLLSGKTVKEEKKERKRAKESSATTGDSITLQGSLLCQSIVKLAAPANAPLLESILATDSSSNIVPIATHANGVHVLLAAVESSKLAFAQRSRLSVKVLDVLETLLNDKFGSRVCDSTFDRADVFFKEKMAKACLQSERQLLASAYGRFFLLKRVQLSLYRKDIEQWKRQMRRTQQQQQQQDARSNENDDDVTASHVVKKQKQSQIDKDLDAILAGV